MALVCIWSIDRHCHVHTHIYGKNIWDVFKLTNLLYYCRCRKKNRGFFDFDWKAQRWNLIVVLGAVIGGFIAHVLLSNPTNIDLNPSTIKELSNLGFENAGMSLLPAEIYSWDAVFTLKGLSILIVGGFLVGFGTRYAGGCTSGHAITGLSSLQMPSLLAVIGFFIGGLIMVHFLFPLIF